jgi:hypothetical protein
MTVYKVGLLNNRRPAFSLLQAGPFVVVCMGKEEHEAQGKLTARKKHV